MMMNNYLESMWKEANSLAKPKVKTSLEKSSLRMWNLTGIV